MATAKEKVEGKANEDAAVDSATKAEQAEGKANEARSVDSSTAKERKEGQSNEVKAGADAAARVDSMKRVADHNGQNRRITSILRESRKDISVNTLRDMNRKLKSEVRRLQEAQGGTPPPPAAV